MGKATKLSDDLLLKYSNAVRWHAYLNGQAPSSSISRQFAPRIFNEAWKEVSSILTSGLATLRRMNDALHGVVTGRLPNLLRGLEGRVSGSARRFAGRLDGRVRKLLAHGKEASKTRTGCIGLTLHLLPILPGITGLHACSWIGGVSGIRTGAMIRRSRGQRCGGWGCNRRARSMLSGGLSSGSLRRGVRRAAFIASATRAQGNGVAARRVVGEVCVVEHSEGLVMLALSGGAAAAAETRDTQSSGDFALGLRILFRLGGHDCEWKLVGRRWKLVLRSVIAWAAVRKLGARWQLVRRNRRSWGWAKKAGAQAWGAAGAEDVQKAVDGFWMVLLGGGKSGKPPQLQKGRAVKLRVASAGGR